MSGILYSMKELLYMDYGQMLVVTEALTVLSFSVRCVDVWWLLQTIMTWSFFYMTMHKHTLRFCWCAPQRIDARHGMYITNWVLHVKSNSQAYIM